MFHCCTKNVSLVNESNLPKYFLVDLTKFQIEMQVYAWVDILWCVSRCI